MIKYVLLIGILFGSVYASDVRIGVGVNIGVPAPVVTETVVVERPSTLVWIPPVYEQRVDAAGNPYLVVIREGYYQRVYQEPIVVQTPVYVAPRPSFSFGFFFGSPSYCGPRFGPPRGPGPFHGPSRPPHR